MNYAVNVEHSQTQQMKITPRKRNPKYTLLYVEQGLVLVRLGKMEYAAEAGQSWWLPFDCLTSLTYMPDTRYSQIDLSVRLQLNLPHQAGQIHLSPLAHEALLRLRHLQRNEPLFEPLSTILKYEAATFQPELTVSPLTTAISQWRPTSDTSDSNSNQSLSAELLLALRVREAYKLEQSGQKALVIAEQLFQGNANQYQQLKQLLLGC
jgi:hypothetical protein